MPLRPRSVTVLAIAICCSPLSGLPPQAISAPADLTVHSPTGRAIAEFQTRRISGSCFRDLPLSNFVSDEGADSITVVQHLQISVDDEDISVPPMVYSILFDVQRTAITYNHGVFDLSLVEGTDLYFVHIYFTAKSGVLRMTVFDRIGGKMVEDATFRQVVLK